MNLQSEAMKDFAARYPALFVVSVMLMEFLLIRLPELVFPKSSINLDLAGKTLTSLLAIFVITGLGWWGETGFTKRLDRSMLIPFLPLLIMPLLMVVSVEYKMLDAIHIVLFALWALLTGFAEEAIFRGIAVRSFLPKGILPAALISSLLFGLFHFSNLIAGGTLLPTTAQVIAATLFGIASAGVLLYTGSIWPLVIIHALPDFIDTLTVVNTGSSTLTDLLLTILLPLPFALYGFWLLRRRLKMEQTHFEKQTADKRR